MRFIKCCRKDSDASKGKLTKFYRQNGGSVMEETCDWEFGSMKGKKKTRELQHLYWVLWAYRDYNVISRVGIWSQVEVRVYDKSPWGQSGSGSGGHKFRVASAVRCGWWQCARHARIRGNLAPQCHWTVLGWPVSVWDGRRRDMKEMWMVRGSERQKRRKQSKRRGMVQMHRYGIKMWRSGHINIHRKEQMSVGAEEGGGSSSAALLALFPDSSLSCSSGDAPISHVSQQHE